MKAINFEGAKNYVVNRLINEASSKLYYHGLHHTFDVYNAAQKFAEMEGINAEELILLKTAALYHDIGFLEQYRNNEVVGEKIAREILPQFGYNAKQIDLISSMIIATDITRSPHTLLEKILCDADLDYLGREDFNAFAGQLKRELNAHGSSFGDKQWDKIQVDFLEKHKYHTTSAIALRESTKQKHLCEIKERLKSERNT